MNSNLSCSGKNYSAKKFTLIEMLVVIAIIGVLASFLMPSLQRSLELTRDISCLSKQKQVGVILFVYSGDYNGRMIGSRLNYDNDINRSAWYVLRREGYLAETDLVMCDKWKDLPPAKYLVDNPSNGDMLSQSFQTFFPNQYLMPDFTATPVFRPDAKSNGNISSISSPSKAFLFACYLYNWGVNSQVCKMGFSRYTEIHAYNNSLNPIKWVSWGVPAMHQDGTNLLYADGHGAYFNPYLEDYTSKDLWYRQ